MSRGSVVVPEEVGIELTTADDLEHMTQVFDSMVEHLFGKPRPGLLDVPGMSPEQAGSYYAAAAEFFRQSPWKKVGHEAAIKVECDRYDGGPWYAVLMGQSGLARGVAMYEDLGILNRMWEEEASDEEQEPRMIERAR